MSYEPILLGRLLERADRETYRGHMPGHKGKPVLPEHIERIDFTELCDTGNLYDPDPQNIIREAEQSFARALSAAADPTNPTPIEAPYCAGGSTLLIQAALATVVENAKCSTWNISKPARILAARDAHRSFFSACALLGCSVDFLYPEYSPDGIAVGVPPDALRTALRTEKYDAVYLTAPNYYGSFCRARELAAVCAELDVPLIVDAAHAAHLVCRYGIHGRGRPKFVSTRSCPVRRGRIARGGDDLPKGTLGRIFLGTTRFGDSWLPQYPKYVAIMSAHKTLEALGGAAFALSGGEYFTKEKLLRGMQLFGSSSPSYAILASLDRALSRALSDGGKDEFDRVFDRVDDLRCNLYGVDGVSIPLVVSEDNAQFGGTGTYDSLRLTVQFAGITGRTAAEWMEQHHGVVAEMADDRFVVFILTAADTPSDLDRLERAIVDCAKHFATHPDPDAPPAPESSAPPTPERVTDMRTALFSSAETIPLADAVDRVAAEILAPYPPGVPVIAPGEKITQKALSFLGTKWYNMNRMVRVLRAEPQSKEDK